MKKQLRKLMACLLAVAMVLSSLMASPDGIFGRLGMVQTAHAETITPSKPATGDGTAESPYEISTAAELYWFAGLVNNDASVCTGEVTKNTAANAVLTADITVNQDVLDAEGNLQIATSAAIAWTPIGTDSNPYTGTFDGGGHTISGLYFNDTSTSYVGLFGYVGYGGSVSNVGVVDSYFSGNNYVGGVCGWNAGTIKCSYNTGEVSGTSSYVGGVCGRNGRGTIEGCYYDKIVASGIYAYQTSVSDANVSTATNVCGKTTAQFKSGEVTYLLNGSTSEGTLVWGQTLSGDAVDTYPVFHNDSNTVYATKGCVIYNNDSNEIKIDHDFNGDGICTVCGTYEISTKEQLSDFAKAVNGGKTDINAILTADIKVNTDVLSEEGVLSDKASGFEKWTPIGTDSNPYTGTFDGGGHTISGLYFNNSSTAYYVGFFGYVGEGGSVSNVGVVDSYLKGRSSVGGVCGYNDHGTIEDCYNSGVVSGNQRFGGVCGFNDRGTIKGCYYDKTVAAGISAIGYQLGAVTNVFGKSTEQFKSGEVTYLLNGFTSEGTLVWGQTLSGDAVDTYPVFHNDSNTVYVTKGCVTYTNDSNEIKIDHDFNGDGICTVCGTHEISTKEQLSDFAAAVNGGKTDIDAVLAADITVNQDVLDENGKLTLATESAITWTPIGTSSNSYTGTFDGGGHTVSGLYFDDEGTSNVGLFGCVGEEGTVVGVGVVDSYFSGYKYVGGVCGRNYGTIEDSYNSGAVSGTTDYVGGVCGSNYGTIKCSYNSGAVSGNSDDVGGVCGSNYYGTIEGSHNSGAVSGDDYVGGVCGDHRGTIKDSYNSGAVSGSGDVGGVCGDNYGTIKDSYNSGAVSGNEEVGGVCGENYRGTIEFSYNTGTVSGNSDDVGGVCGENFEGIIKDSYNSGAVSGSGDVGGVCGYNTDGTIEDSYNSGDVSGSDDVGGVCGENYRGTIEDSYNSGAVRGTTDYVGGVCGGDYGGTITNCYYNSDICTAGAINLKDVTGEAVGLTTLQMTAPDALTTMKLGSGWEKKPADTEQKKVFYPDLAAIKDDEPSVTYEAVLVLTNTNTNPVYGDDLSFTLDASVKFGGIEESVPLIGNCTSKDFKLLYKGENLGSISSGGSTMTALVRGGVDAGNQTISLQYVGSRYDFLSGLTGDCPVTIGKAIPAVTAPTATNAIVYGKPLSDITLSDTKWSWVDGTVIPTVTNNGYKAVRTVTDYDNYDYSKVEGYDKVTHTITRTIAVTVNKSQNAPNMPSATMNVAKSCTKVSDVTLPKDWVWQDADQNTALVIDTPMTATAVYNGADKGNYVNETVSVTITRSSCEHNYIGKVTTEPTTEKEGVRTYTCDRCGHSYTESIPKLPDNRKPYIKDDTGKEGWDVIRDELDKTKDGDTVVVEMNGSSVVPGNVFDEIKGKDVTIVFDMGDGITWSVNGQSITGDRIGDIDFSVTVDTNTIPVDVINNVTGERYSKQISLAYEGEFGFTAVLSINMDKKNAGLYANLFYYNEKTGKLEFICADKIAEDGTAELTFTHASDYTIVIDKTPMDGSGNSDNKDDAPDTGDRTPVVWLFVLVVLSGTGLTFAVKKSRIKIKALIK